MAAALFQAFELPAQVISLRRSTERRDAFVRRNADTGLEYAFVDGVDGVEQWGVISKSRRAALARQSGWSKGAIGSGLSHCLMWRRCLELNRPICVLEEDVLVASDWQQRCSQALDQAPAGTDFLLLGWNFDSVLRAEIFSGVGCISLFEPAFPSLPQIRSVLDQHLPRQVVRLHKALGLPGYVVTPRGAQKLLHGLPSFEAEPLVVGRGIPEVPSMTLDAQMNRLYCDLQAFVVVSPLVLAENNQQTSLTAPGSFGAEN
ncbi:glycosyltransferase family 25 protein [Synechococcus sp. PROS-U-1]|uniref:glycosyltransferase family 25 protein n=1 Tax=Synechococcus sp. PROS-U-1 TaxID=1400866 RepID=UPI001645FC28|nr:glycosyltransferase family 25 protein [Synechococcus sp. PROS-U-1]QNJ01739.1 glycosyltransferase 25 family protein [Synechococcus sp. PROS-U-1]